MLGEWLRPILTSSLKTKILKGGRIVTCPRKVYVGPCYLHGVLKVHMMASHGLVAVSLFLLLGDVISMLQ